jgi:4-alpha-glucanotransferase
VTRRISLALAIHNHQPVGNFGWVIGEVYNQAYRPLVESLERHPGVRVALHYTGPLFEWLQAEQPDFLDRLAVLVRRDQVELMGGGLYEPVLASLPEHDRVAQLTRMADAVERLCGRRPRGAWLAERVWEPDLPASLVAAGYGWTILDDQHFRAAAIPEQNLWGTYTTEDQGRLLTVFGTEQGLRYRIPFGTVDDVIEHLRANATEAGDRLGTMGDDGEKFGAWPTTFEHCWGSGRWVERFMEALEANADWLTTVTPSAWLEREPPIGRVYVPTSSYAEMGEWALPPDESVGFSMALHEAVAAHRPEARWLHGGFWRNFQVRYREINDLHKQMLRTSSKVARMPDGAERALAEDHLHRGQSNDCYWHGLFGGIYISHMRLATYEHLIAAEDLADRSLGSAQAAFLTDLDMDGRDEVVLAEPGQVVTLKPSEGGGIGSWDIRAARHALAAVMRRRPEAYHEKLRTAEPAHGTADTPEATHGAADTRDVPDTDQGDVAQEPGSGGVTSIHELVVSKEEGLARLLFYDDHERRSGLVRFLALDTTPEQLADTRAAELGNVYDGEFAIDHLVPGQVSMSREGSIAGQHVTVVRTVRLVGGRLDPELVVEVELYHRGTAALECRLGLEWSLHLLGGGGNPQAWYEVDGTRSRHDGSGTVGPTRALRYGNDWVGLTVSAAAEPPAEAWWHPIDTISNSEAGFERVYQGSALLVSWPLRLEPGASARYSFRQTVSVERDRTAAEVDAT